MSCADRPSPELRNLSSLAREASGAEVKTFEQRIALVSQDYMEDVHGKEIPLMHTTVKIPGQKPRGSRVAGSQVNDLTSDVGTLSLAGGELLPLFPFPSFVSARNVHGLNPASV